MASAAPYSQQQSATGSESVKPNEAAFVHADDLRTAFAAAMSQMYKEEVPLYADLVRVVSEVNKQVLSSNPKEPPTADCLEHLILERHGAIRLGTARELGTVRRIFTLMIAASTHAEYQLLKEEHPILADIACFKTAHINHLTPRTLDIGRAQQAMLSEHMAIKERIEGPPPRQYPILLRQTSFLAMEERVQFRSGDHQAAELIDGTHRARFGEIEERGAAVTPAGRALYDKLLQEASDSARGLSAEEADRAFEIAFQKFPDTWDGLWKNGLAYFKYQWTGKPCDLTVIKTGQSRNEELLDGLIIAGVIETVPITYEDFLPFSAAGIFQSNLGHGSGLQQGSVGCLSDLIGLEAALGCSVVDADSLYSVAQQKSLISCLGKLKGSGSEL
ncbi:hypothetical protein KJ359_005009 [Pestalotiopsis sp. 9143b]|nr:hypothetical protein KJ359_005009 [Pestalotiopsis sp. 9143b]